MSITVARIDNLFWNNNSYKKPNALPVFRESRVIKRRPVIYDFMGGRTHIEGDQWNYAIYEGTYYFLIIDKTYDARKKHFGYVLVRDIWMNILLKNVVDVRGRLTCTARDEWLSANLNRTVALLEDPVRVTRITLGGETFVLSKHVSIREATKSLPVIVLSRGEIDDFKTHFTKAASAYKFQLTSPNKLFFKEKKSPIFIFGLLKGFESHSYSWKENVKGRVNAFLKELKSLSGRKGHEEDIVVSRVGDGFGSLLKDKYCVTWNEGGIGSAKETIKLHEIDLSGLEDIVQIDMTSLKEFSRRDAIALPYMKKIDESLFANFFDFRYSGQMTYKIRRKIYFPMTTTTTNCGIGMVNGPDDNRVDNAAVNWRYLCPQKISTRIGKMFLSYLNDINFVISYWKTLYVRSGTGYTPTVVYRPDNRLFKGKPAITWTYPHHSYNDISDWHFYDRDSELFTPIGFLIFGFFNYKTFDGFVCKADGELNKIRYISGLKNSQLWKIYDGSFFEDYKSPLYELPYSVGSRFTYSEKPSENWQRFWHNVTNSLEMLLLPNGKGYEYSWRAFRRSDRLSGQYPIRALQTDQAVWGSLGAPFKDRKRHEASILRSYELIDKVAMKTIVEMPVTIKKGDYLFTDMEYWMSEFDHNILATTKYQVEGVEETAYGGSFVRTHFYKAQNLLLEDFLHSPGNIQEGLEGVAIISTLKGDLELRKINTFAILHRLHGSTYSEEQIENPLFLQTAFDSFRKEVRGFSDVPRDLATDEQSVISVDETTSKRVGYLALTSIDNGKLPNTEPLNKKFIKKAIYEFLKMRGYVVSDPTELENDFIASVLMLGNDEFDGNLPLLFDLKGTDWYAYIKKGKVSLIAKDPEIFDKTTDKIMTIPREANLEKLSTIEKVNQKCILTVRTHERKLKTRFKFNEDNIDLTVSNIVTSKNSVTEYFFLALRGDFDVIEKDIISVPKSQLTSSVQGNNLELETLRVQMLRNDRNYETAMERDIYFGTEKLTEEYRHQQRNLELARARQIFNALFGGAEAFGGLMTMAATKGNTLEMVGFGSGAVNRVVGGMFGFFDVDERIKHTEKQREFSFRQLAYNSLKIDITHRDLEEDSIRRINQVSHVYRKGTVNDTDLMREFRKTTEGLEENKEIFLTVFTPSGEQLRLLEIHKEEYGVDCDIPQAIITFKDGMAEEVVKFKNLNDEGLIGLENIKEREYLLASLEMGMKVVNVSHNVEDSGSDYVCANLQGLTRNLEDSRDAVLSSTKKMQMLEAENKRLKEDVVELERCTAEKAEKNSEIDRLTTEMNEKRSEIDRLTTEHNILKSAKDLQDAKVIELDQKIEKLEKDLRDRGDELTSLNEKKAELDSKIQDLEKKLSDKEIEITTATEEKTQLQKKLSDKEIELDDAQKKAASDKEKLDEEIRRHKIDKEEAEQKWDDCKRDYLNEKDAHNRLAREKDELDQKMRDLESFIKQRESLESQKSDLERQLADVTSSKNDLERQLAETQKAKSDSEGERDRLAQTIAKNTLTIIQLKRSCSVLAKHLSTPYEVNRSQEDSGFNMVAEMAFQLAKTAKWIRQTSMELSLSKFDGFKKLFTLIAEMEDIPIVDRTLDILENPNATELMKWLKVGGDPSEKIKPLIPVIEGIEAIANNPSAHAMKASIDEILWQALECRRLGNGDGDVDHRDFHMFFGHFFPGEVIPELYKKLYGVGIDVALGKRQFRCEFDEDGTSNFESLISEKWFDDIGREHHFNESLGPKDTDESGVRIEKMRISPYFFPKENTYRSGWTVKRANIANTIFKHPKMNAWYKRATILFECHGETAVTKFDHWIGFRIQRNVFDEVYKKRLKMWVQRHAVTLSDAVEKRLKADEFIINLKVPTPSPYSSPTRKNKLIYRGSPGGSNWKRIDLKKIFGHKLKDALILLAIMFYKSFGWRREIDGGNDGFEFDCWSIRAIDYDGENGGNIDIFIRALAGIPGEVEGLLNGKTWKWSSPFKYLREWGTRNEAVMIGQAAKPALNFNPLVLKTNEDDDTEGVSVSMGIEFANAESLVNYLYTTASEGIIRNTFRSSFTESSKMIEFMKKLEDVAFDDWLPEWDKLGRDGVVAEIDRPPKKRDLYGEYLTYGTEKVKSLERDLQDYWNIHIDTNTRFRAGEDWTEILMNANKEDFENASPATVRKFEEQVTTPFLQKLASENVLQEYLDDAQAKNEVIFLTMKMLGQAGFFGKDGPRDLFS